MSSGLSAKVDEIFLKYSSDGGKNWSIDDFKNWLIFIYGHIDCFEYKIYNSRARKSGT
eukprot:UN11009